MRNPSLLFAFLAGLTGAPAAAQENAPACSPDERGATTAIVEGSVVDEATRIPLQSVTVHLSWFAPDGRRRSERTETDRHGTFRFCDAPVGVVLSVSADKSDADGRAESMILSAGERNIVQLRAEAGYSRVRGRVIDHQTGRPIPSVSFSLGPDALHRLTGEDGAFVLDSVPPGFYTIRVQHVAYAEVVDSIGIDLFARLELTVRLAPAAIPIDPIEVVVRSGVLERRGFYERQERGIGTFVTREQIDATHPLAGTDLLRRIAGIRLATRRNGFGLIAVGRGDCPFRFVIDGLRVHHSFSLDEMPPTWIEGLEIYKGPSEAPIEYAGLSADPNGNCGVIVVWTRIRI
ncbi:MAG: TonB-dependent receptor [Gemmatimonadetes bacterium]|nr:TonB-dependent receptor [Gemmatimonadota bacterium]